MRLWTVWTHPKFVFSECVLTATTFCHPWSASGLLQTSSHAGLGFNWTSTYIGGVLLGVAFCFHDLALLRMRVFVCLPHEMLTLQTSAVGFHQQNFQFTSSHVNFFIVFCCNFKSCTHRHFRTRHKLCFSLRVLVVFAICGPC